MRTRLALVATMLSLALGCSYGIPCDRINVEETCRPAWDCQDGKRYEFQCTTEDGGRGYDETDQLTCSCMIDGRMTKTFGPVTSSWCTQDERETRSAADGHCGFPIFNQ